MKKELLVFSAALLAVIMMAGASAYAQAKIATIKLNKDVSYQKITGFGGFVNSPQFGYNHMTDSEISKMWGPASEAGYNIMRIYIPIGEANWPQALSTAQQAQSLGLKIFASPWSMPSEWKTYNTTASRYTDENGVVRPVYLKEEHYADYAKYLDDFVTYLRTNGVELYAISLQNEPDYQVDYAGCIWTPAQMAVFIQNHGDQINCRIIAPESVGISDSYANAFVDPAVLPKFDIFGGHQYGAIQSGLLNVQAQGKEVWMTEFLINWNAGGSSRNFSWQTDGFDFANKVNEALLANVNAWVHYATKRYYGPMGDGQFGTEPGVITKRGNILSHYAKYVTGSRRIQTTWNDNTSELRGSSYISEAGDKVFIVVINPSANTYNLAVDLPFLSNSGKVITTTQTASMTEADAPFTEETARPKVPIEASSVTTLVFTKSGERSVSQMTGELVNYGKIEDQTVTNPAFGTAYQLSGKTATLKYDMPLLSANKDAGNGYIQLSQKFNRLVFRVNNLSSTLNYSSSNTTLYYIDSTGSPRSHNYGNLNFTKRDNFDLVFDISEDVLPDGCTGILGVGNGNYSSVLTFKFGNVYFAVGNEKGYKFSGIYNHSDSNLLDCFDDPGFTSLDFRNVTDIPSGADWRASSPNKNTVFYVNGPEAGDKSNVIDGLTCQKLELSDAGGDFYPPYGFTAAAADYSCTLNGLRMLVLPFEANIPVGVKAYTIKFTDPKITGMIITSGKIPANTPVLVTGQGNFRFEGSGPIATSANLRTGAASSEVTNNNARTMEVGITGGVYIGIKAPIGSYYLTNSDGSFVFSRVTAGAQPAVNPFNAYLAPGLPTAAPTLEVTLDETALPVHLSMFVAKLVENVVNLEWTTQSENNNAGFDIERSADARTFKTIAYVKGLGDTETEKRYELTDHYPLPGTSYYRLKQTDLDGTYAHSQVRAINNTGSKPIVVYPNPVGNTLTIDLDGQKADTRMLIYDVSGRQVLQPEPGKTTFDVSMLAPGIYFYRLDDYTGSFVKN